MKYYKATVLTDQNKRMNVKFLSNCDIRHSFEYVRQLAKANGLEGKIIEISVVRCEDE